MSKREICTFVYIHIRNMHYLLQELFAYGITGVCSSFFSSYSPSGSLSRSLVQETVGGKTQLVGLISSSILLAVIYLIAPLFEPLPKVIPPDQCCCINACM